MTDNDIVEGDFASEEEIILQEREEKYKTGKISFDPWEVVERRLRDKAEERSKKRK
jgi:hypothetical protein